MGEVIVRFIAALWHVVGLIVLVVLFTEFGVDWLRRRIRRLRRGRTTRPARAAGADAYGGADWTTPYFDEFSRSVRVDWKEHVGWWQRPHRGEYVTIDERGLRATPGEREAGRGRGAHPVFRRLDDDGHGRARRAYDPGGAGAPTRPSSATRPPSPIWASSGTTTRRRRSRCSCC